MLAFFLKRRKAMMKDISMGVIPYFMHAGVVVVLLMLQPDFGSILILSPIVLAMYFVGNGNVRFVAIAILAVTVGAVGVYGLGKAFGEQTKL
jgi:stage V sporulation protein E